MMESITLNTDILFLFLSLSHEVRTESLPDSVRATVRFPVKAQDPVAFVGLP